MLSASLIFLQHGANQTEKNKNISQAFKAWQGILAGIAILFCALILDKIVQGKKN